ncbi:hypothetical protein BMS3Abin07_01620 [bacterium BMS3Abin07]|nr:hypothetical protein BMS3Abin07_01620 [bacterium BMS3Abin07]
MRLIEKKDGISFESRYYLKIILFILIMLPFLLLINILEYSIHPYSLLLYAIFAGLISLTYKKSISFEKSQNKLIYNINVLCLKLYREYSFQDIDSVTLHTVRSPIMGVQIPLPIEKCSLDISFLNGKHIHVDRSSDVSAMKKNAEIISDISLAIIIEK